MASEHVAGLILERRRDVRTGRLNRRGHAEEDAGQRRDREREGENPPVRRRRDRRRRVRADEESKHGRRADGGNHDTSGPSSEREQHAFDQQLSRDPRARRAECEPYGDLALPGRAAREEQVRDVGAGDQENAGGGRHQHPERRGQRPAEPGPALRGRNHLQRVRGVALSRLGCRPREIGILQIGLNQRGEVRRQPRLRLPGRDPGPEPCEHADPSKQPLVERVPARCQLRLHHHRHEHACRTADFHAVEPRLRHANDGVGMSIDDERAVDDAGIRREAADPEAVADHGHWMTAGELVVLRCQRPPERGANAQHREVGAGHDLPGHPFGPPGVADVERVSEAAEHAGEHVVVVAELLIDRVRQFTAVAPVTAVPAALERHLDQLVRIVHPQHSQEHLVHEREDRRIGANAERDRADRDGGEARHLAPGTKCEPGVGEQAVHGGLDGAWAQVV